MGRIWTRAGIAASFALLAMTGCASHARMAEVAPAIGSGEASYYHDNFAGSRTASGERYDPGALTAAHRTLPFGTRVRVTDLETGRSVVVRVNDRGPWKRGIIDISRAAAEKIGLVRRGRGQVRLSLAEDQDDD